MNNDLYWPRAFNEHIVDYLRANRPEAVDVPRQLFEVLIKGCDGFSCSLQLDKAARGVHLEGSVYATLSEFTILNTRETVTSLELWDCDPRAYGDTEHSFVSIRGGLASTGRCDIAQGMQYWSAVKVMYRFNASFDLMSHNRRVLAWWMAQLCDAAADLATVATFREVWQKD